MRRFTPSLTSVITAVLVALVCSSSPVQSATKTLYANLVGSVTGNLTGNQSGGSVNATTVAAISTISANAARVDVAGDVGSATGASSGRYWFGRAGSAMSLDCGVTIAAVCTFSNPLTVSGQIASVAGSAVSLANGAGFSRIGGEAGLNVIGDYQSIQARNNGAASTLNLQLFGGTTTLGGPLQLSAGTASACVGTDASKNLAYNSNCVKQVTAGSSKVTVTPSGSSVAIDLPAQPVNTITSADSSVGIVSSAGGASIDLSVSKAGAVVKAIGQGSVGTGSVTVSLPVLPGSGGANYKVIVTYVFGAAAGGTTEAYAFSGTVGNTSGSSTNNGFTYAVGQDTATGGMAPSVAISGAGGTTGGPVQISLEAIRQ